MAGSSTPALLGNRYGKVEYRKRVIRHTSLASTGTFNVTSTMSGAVFSVATISTAHFSLPRISSNELGLEYEFFISSQAAAQDVAIVSTIDSSAAIEIAGITTAASTASAITPAIPGEPSFVRLLAVSSVSWIAQPAVHFSSETTGGTILSEDLAGNFIAGTTQA